MGQPRDPDPALTVAHHFGAELRRHRLAKGLKQDQLGELIGYSGVLVGLIENARRSPSRRFAELCDEVLGTDGQLTRLWPLVGSLPSWFQKFAELESSASGIQTFETQLIPGLFQTEAYMRALFQPVWTDTTELDIAGRLERQKIFMRAEPPRVWAIIDESALHRPYGGPEVMKGQLKRLTEIAGPRTVVQILPFEASALTSMDSPMTILSHTEGPDVIYFEGLGIGQLISHTAEVAQVQHWYNVARAVALPPAASLELITRKMEELES
ncbi:MAG TPA: helix-turn-helix transcriptional regulator [Actinocrinis sp.]|nr:helix-turn-helix transcriptional regulator [Actinocrinis sp.]